MAVLSPVPWLRRPAVALVVAAGLWGVAVSGTKYALGGFDPVTLLSIELLAGAAVLWVALLVRGYRPPRSWWLPAVLGLLEPALAYLGDTFGLSLTSAVHGAVINGLESGLVVLLAAVLLRETVTRPAILAIVVALGGLAVLAGVGAGASGSTAAGDLLVAGGVLSASLYTIVAKRFDDGSDALSLTAWQFTVAALVSLLVTIARWTAGFGTWTGTVSAAPRFWLVAVLVGACGFGFSFLLFNMVIVQVDAGRAAVVLNLIPVFGVASAVIFLGEGMTGRDALGAVLIGSSVVYFAIADHREATAQAVGIAQGALDFAVGYVKERKQFGTRIADFQGIQFMLADMAMTVEAARQLVYVAAAKSERHDADLSFFSAAAKCYASDVAMQVTTDAVQLLGGYGFTQDFPVERMMRDAKITQIYEGTNQIQRVVMARQLLGSPEGEARHGAEAFPAHPRLG